MNHRGGSLFSLGAELPTNPHGELLRRHSISKLGIQEWYLSFKPFKRVLHNFNPNKGSPKVPLLSPQKRQNKLVPRIRVPHSVGLHRPGQEAEVTPSRVSHNATWRSGNLFGLEGFPLEDLGSPLFHLGWGSSKAWC